MVHPSPRITEGASHSFGIPWSNCYLTFMTVCHIFNDVFEYSVQKQNVVQYIIIKCRSQNTHRTRSNKSLKIPKG